MAENSRETMLQSDNQNAF